MKKILIMVCALVSACSTDVNGNPCLAPLSGCAANADATGGNDGMGGGDIIDQVDGSGGQDGISGSDSEEVDTKTDSSVVGETDGTTGGEGYLVVHFDTDKYLSTEAPLGAEVWIGGEYGPPSEQKKAHNEYWLSNYYTWNPEKIIGQSKYGKETKILLPEGKHMIAFQQKDRISWKKGLINPFYETEDWDMPYPVEIKAGETVVIDMEMRCFREGYWVHNTHQTHPSSDMEILEPSEYCEGGGPSFLGFCFQKGDTYENCKEYVGGCEWHGWGKISQDCNHITVNRQNYKTGEKMNYTLTYTGKL